MNYSLFISPAAGAVIGYFTNWLAIKMLFKPHNEVKIGPFKVPFTPGIIPKEKGRIAVALGDAVGNYLLTAEVLSEAVAKPEISGAVNNAADKIIDFLKTSDKTVSDIISDDDKKTELYGYIKNVVTSAAEGMLVRDDFIKLVTDAIFNKIKELMELEIAELELTNYKGDIKYAVNMLFRGLSGSEDVKEGVEKCLWDYLLSCTQDERTLGDCFSEDSVRALKDYASVKAPDVVNGILKMIDDPEVDELLRDKVREAISRNAGLLGMFINTETIYDKVVTEIKTFFNDPENGPEIDRTVDIVVDKIMLFTVGQTVGLLTGEMREMTVKRLVSAAMDAALTDDAADMVVDKIVSYAQKEGNRQIKELVYDFVPEFDNRAYEKLYTVVGNFLKNDAKTFLSSALDELLGGIMKSRIKDIGGRIGDGTYQNLKGVILSAYGPVAVKAAPFVVDAINIPKIVEERINSFDMDIIEELILGIASKELSAITWFGGLLGLVIGFVPVIVQLLGM